MSDVAAIQQLVEKRLALKTEIAKVIVGYYQAEQLLAELKSVK